MVKFCPEISKAKKISYVIAKPQLLLLTDFEIPDEKRLTTLRNVWFFSRKRKRLLALGHIYRAREKAPADRFVLWPASGRKEAR
jgi:hypothetical protein